MESPVATEKEPILLVIDPSLAIQNLLGIYFARRGMRTLPVLSLQDDPIEAPEAAPDMVVVDPRIDGRDPNEVHRQLSRKFPKTPILFLAASQYDPELLHLGPDAIVRKTLPMDHLRSEIERLLVRSRQHLP